LNSRVQLEIVSTVHQQNVATSDLDFVIRMGDPGEDELVGKKVANVSLDIRVRRILGKTPGAAHRLQKLNASPIIGQTAEFPRLQKRTAPAK